MPYLFGYPMMAARTGRDIQTPFGEFRRSDHAAAAVSESMMTLLANFVATGWVDYGFIYYFFGSGVENYRRTFRK